MDKYAEQILNRLLDKYEGSKSFIGDNEVKQTFYLYPGKEFPRYNDDSDYNFFVEINEVIALLEQSEFIVVQREKNGIVKRVGLQINKIDIIYSKVERISKRKENNWILDQLEDIRFENSLILKDYVYHQKERLADNKKVEFYNGKHIEYKNLLQAVCFAEKNENEIFIRDASMRLFNDSKYFSKIINKVQGLMFQYGNYEEKKTVLEECGIVKTPTYVVIKGNVCIEIARQKIDLSKINGDIALSTKTIEELNTIKVLGNQVVTIENLTTFHDYNSKNSCCIYLGGFHNQIKRKFIMKLYSQNQNIEYCHFGDIDAGGYYIYEHLVEKTGVNFKIINMNVATLEKNRKLWKKLTVNDKNRLKKLKEHIDEKETNGKLVEDYRNVLNYMVKNNCKLEQEAIYAISDETYI